jgi:predicted transport protein
MSLPLSNQNKNRDELMNKIINLLTLLEHEIIEKFDEDFIHCLTHGIIFRISTNKLYVNMRINDENDECNLFDEIMIGNKKNDDAMKLRLTNNINVNYIFELVEKFVRIIQ